jgi:hypothetical protein
MEKDGEKDFIRVYFIRLIHVRNAAKDKKSKQENRTIL